MECFFSSDRQDSKLKVKMNRYEWIGLKESKWRWMVNYFLEWKHLAISFIKSKEGFKDRLPFFIIYVENMWKQLVVSETEVVEVTGVIVIEDL